ncbi:MAG: hypothetical protein LBJ61_03135 [Deltaproteobacteria bacterium]|nr:hypothetical protein [Deltaproteobacteria bacterium]
MAPAKSDPFLRTLTPFDSFWPGRGTYPARPFRTARKKPRNHFSQALKFSPKTLTSPNYLKGY